jgi:putative flippase GtrA
MTDVLLPRAGVIGRFGLVGVAATAVHAVVLTLLITVGKVWPPAANLGAFLVAVGVSYLGHRNFTFQSDRPHHQGLPTFIAVASFGAVANLGVFTLFNAALGIPWPLTFLISMATVTPLVYLLTRDTAFGDKTRFSLPDLRIWAAPTVFFAVAAVATVLLYYPLPYFDHWDFVPFYDRAAQGQLSFGDLFAPHGGHWHATGYMVLLTLDRLTGMSHLAQVIASLVIAAAGGTVLIRLLVDCARRLEIPATAPWMAAAAGFFWFSLDQASNWFWGWQVAVFLNTAGAVLAIFALSRQVLTLKSVAVAVIGAAIAIYAFATGLVLLPIGLLLILMHPAERRARIPAAIAWAIFSVLILAHYQAAVLQPAAGHVAAVTPKQLDGPVLVQLAVFTLNFVGGAVGRFSDGLPVIAAVMGGAAALIILRNLRFANAEATAALAPLVALILYGVGSGVLTAYGRLAYGADQALVGRYITFGNFYWLGVLPILIAGAAHAQGAFGQRGLAALAGLFLLMKVGVLANVVFDNDLVQESRRIQEAAVQIRRAYPTAAPEALALVAAPDHDAQNRAGVLARDKVSLFHDGRP